MRKKKISFLIPYDYWNNVKDMTTEEKADFLDFCFKYNLTGEMPDLSKYDRFMQSILNSARRHFDESMSKYQERCIDQSLSRKIGYAKQNKDADEITALKEKKAFLKSHGVDEFIQKYKEYAHVITYVTDIDTDIDIDGDRDIDIDIDIDSDTDIDIDTDIDSDIDSEIDTDGDRDARGRGRRDKHFVKPTLAEVKKYFSSLTTTASPDIFYEKQEKAGWKDIDGIHRRRWEELVIDFIVAWDADHR